METYTTAAATTHDSMNPATAGRLADTLDAHLERVADGTWTPARFIDSMADFATLLRSRSTTPTIQGELANELESGK